MNSWNSTFESFCIYTVGIIIVVSAMLGLSYLLGQHHKERETNDPYESGILITGSSRIRFDAKFYLIAMVFVIFDLESVFLFAWSIAVSEAGWPGYYSILFFSTVLIMALAYTWRTGGFNFGPHGRQLKKMEGTEL